MKARSVTRNPAPSDRWHTEYLDATRMFPWSVGNDEERDVEVSAFLAMELLDGEDLDLLLERQELSKL